MKENFHELVFERGLIIWLKSICIHSWSIPDCFIKLKFFNNFLCYLFFPPAPITFHVDILFIPIFITYNKNDMDNAEHVIRFFFSYGLEKYFKILWCFRHP